jgi:hypothetical protein
MLQARHYTTFLEVRGPDGHPWLCELALTPIGLSGMIPASFWTQLLNNLAKRPQITELREELDSLQRNLPNGPKSLCDECYGKGLSKCTD